MSAVDFVLDLTHTSDSEGNEVLFVKSRIEHKKRLRNDDETNESAGKELTSQCNGANGRDDHLRPPQGAREGAADVSSDTSHIKRKKRRPILDEPPAMELLSHSNGANGRENHLKPTPGARGGAADVSFNTSRIKHKKRRSIRDVLPAKEMLSHSNEANGRDNHLKSPQGARIGATEMPSGTYAGTDTSRLSEGKPGTQHIVNGDSNHLGERIARSKLSHRTETPSPPVPAYFPVLQHALMFGGNGGEQDISGDAEPSPVGASRILVHEAVAGERPAIRGAAASFLKDTVLNLLEMEVLWLCVESVYCASDCNASAVDWEFVWFHASPSLQVELRKISDTASDEERLSALIRMNDWLVKRRFEFVRENCLVALIQGFRRPSMALTIAECSMKHRQRQGAEEADEDKL
jgi:hypothetical protein